MDKELTFYEMVNKEIAAKKALQSRLESLSEGLEGAKFISPSELISKLGKDSEHSDKDAWRIAAELKKLGITRGFTDYHWETLELAETVPLGIAAQEEKSQIPFYIERIDELLERLVKWSSNLSFADRNKEEEVFLNRSMDAGERLLKARREFLKELS